MMASQEVKPAKKDKTPTALISYNFYRQGKNIEEITKERGLVVGTIQGHLCQFVENGELEVSELLPTLKLNRIIDEYHSGKATSNEIKESIGPSPDDTPHALLGMVSEFRVGDPGVSAPSTGDAGLADRSTRNQSELFMGALALAVALAIFTGFVKVWSRRQAQQ
jgi:hypothetical protein